ncbi:pre-rRNA 2'-O-ribose RNA methyltransferase FTSJ3-like [Pollicipes pollicipes]|uniref:pre-rRNA 2'-O-ribose RNA methyltransferase FTSJ3-like n=1 Tax=Pollicipes pollicipes TaxID=41117 RepID=UPI001885A0F4|nr:pre-rRNA 2'-O-ribose RNA methyltransferase FTSJ3-like [Pollicipes pollicipes]
MGVKHQTGKQRKDKFYHLAKETGFRARSAFKLIQLNRKFEFLQKARVVVDLCAAPGSWMQVARQNMPISSICVGVDLVPIKPIPNCIALKEDITTDKCRQALKRELKTWRADVVMNDGAPNVGKSWLHDAFKQAELTLSALALATEFLRKGGWFVTKIFRSKDYHALIWVFKMLFNKVHATKPQASRNESAEIFVVCQGFKAPDKIDPKFLSSKYVFGELNEEKPTQLVLGRPQKKEKAVGYADGEATVFSVLPASEFISKPNHLEMLQGASKIVFDTDVIANHPSTTDEIRSSCEDIKVLGKAEIKALIKWRKKLKEQLEKKEEVEPPKKEESEDDEEDELAKIDQQIADLKAQQHAEAKKKRKKLLQERRKILEKLRASGYSTEGRVETSEQDLFALRDVKDPSKAVDADLNDIPVEEEAVEHEEGPTTRQFARDHETRDAMGNFDPSVEDRLDEDELQWVDDDAQDPDGLGLEADGEDRSDEEEEDEEEPQLLVDDIQLTKGGKVSSLERRARKAELWFDKDVFESIEDEADEDFELEQAIKSHEAKGGTLFSGSKVEEGRAEKSTKRLSKESAAKEKDADLNKFDSDSEEEEVDATAQSDDDAKSDSDTDSDSDDEPRGKRSAKRGKRTAEPSEAAPSAKKRVVKLDAEGLTLGSMMIHSKKARRDIVDASYNRYAFDDVNLPAWFVDDEKRHMRWRPELDPALLAEYKERLKDVDARPIKKVAEAKARKKRRLQKRMEKARHRAEAVVEKEDTTTMEKARELRKIYKRARSKKQQEVKYVVAKKSTTHGKRAQRPAGVKGHYKVVDPRMKKDMRGMQKGGKGAKSGRPAKGGTGRGGGKGRGGKR